MRDDTEDGSGGISSELEFVLNAVAGDADEGSNANEGISSSGGGNENNPSPSDDLSPLLSSSLNMASRAGSEGRYVACFVVRKKLIITDISIN